jgi:predicted nuclease with RNAse H fold
MTVCEPTFIGIDVGAASKGYHAVAFRGKLVAGKLHSSDSAVVAQWCNEQGARVIAIDAPCRWRTHGQPARAAERELAADRISCFSTPTEEKAKGHAFFTWMIAGAEMYSALNAEFPLYDGGSRREFVAIETFPQAVACALAGEIVSAKRKNDVRRELIRLGGIDPTAFANIDEIDAALCAFAAESFVRDDFKSYGDVEGGFIVVPKTRVVGFVGDQFLSLAKPVQTAPRRPSAQRGLKDDDRWQWFGVTPAFLEEKAAWLREERALHSASRRFFETAATMVAFARYDYPLASVAYFHATLGLERALRLHYADEETKLTPLLAKARADGFVNDAMFREVPAFTPEFEKMVGRMLNGIPRTHAETLVQIVPKLRNEYFHGTYLLAPDYLHLACQLRVIADGLTTRRLRGST